MSLTTQHTDPPFLWILACISVAADFGHHPSTCKLWQQHNTRRGMHQNKPAFCNAPNKRQQCETCIGDTERQMSLKMQPVAIVCTKSPRKQEHKCQTSKNQRQANCEIRPSSPHLMHDMHHSLRSHQIAQTPVCHRLESFTQQLRTNLFVCQPDKSCRLCKLWRTTGEGPWWLKPSGWLRESHTLPIF